tara:strand:- start:33 stop:572 length:540 start_codon:yes stop_codon:yes gene_type:complete
MKKKYLIRALPLLSTLLLIILFSITNQKQNTKLRILIWNTPSFSLGSYLAISTGSGFILSYIITNTLAKVKQPKLKKVIKYTYESKLEEPYEINNSYDNNLIERDFKDPSPTINAKFRVIGKTTRKNRETNNSYSKEYEDSNFSDGRDYQSYNEDKNLKTDKDINQMSNDWYDESYSDW